MLSKKDPIKKHLPEEGDTEPPLKAEAAGGVTEGDAPGENNDPAVTSEQGEIDRLTGELAAVKDQLLRTAAEFDNFRKRTRREKEAAYADATALAVAALLPPLDNLERALAAPDASGEDLRKGLAMTCEQFGGAFRKLGIEEIPVDGPFDPTLHDAVFHVEDEAYGEGAIVECLQKGYRMGDKVIRHAVVKVAN